MEKEISPQKSSNARPIATDAGASSITLRNAGAVKQKQTVWRRGPAVSTLPERLPVLLIILPGVSQQDILSYFLFT